MTRYVICPEVALHLAVESAILPSEHQLLAPTLLRKYGATLRQAPPHAREEPERGGNRRRFREGGQFDEHSTMRELGFLLPGDFLGHRLQAAIAGDCVERLYLPRRRNSTLLCSQI